MTTFAEVLASYPRPIPGVPGDPGLFGPYSAVWRNNGERVLLLGGGRALLMQLAHPIVAAGVADRSGFERDPWERLWGTLEAVLAVTFGDTVQAHGAADRVTAMHRNVTGERDGVPYAALDPALLLWVHATIVDSSLVTYERFVRRMPRPTKERYFLEMRAFARAFAVPDAVLPPDLVAFEAYVASMLPRLHVSDEANRLASRVLEPPVPAALRPARALQRLVTVGLLPRSIREGFGLPWSGSRERAFRAIAAAIRNTLPLVPRRLRAWPHALEAARRMSVRSERD